MNARNRGVIPASGQRLLVALIPGRFALVWIVCFSVSVNLLLLVVPFYSIEVFDRVLSSGSVETLVGLTVIAVGALAFSAAFDTFRNRLLSRFAVGFEHCLAPIILEGSITGAAPGDGRQHDLVKLRELRSFMSGGTVTSLSDAPFLPAFILILFFRHAWNGIIALIGVVILLTMGVAKH